ncbi:uncharacterized protein DUF1353 [Palleronia aestuarii]|uniref:Uncharacterized protein DUF1353 n=1 Tax=Palleronia aestuarii TaxID=568105 RepID=A0A2W7N5Z2_9RHOB|nr:DUF1353 domain-containing protein [Palleronia aestuarii]PZX12264.1 uncharacterized protein DUF1353 [Palleronia aestuarii]
MQGDKRKVPMSNPYPDEWRSLGGFDYLSALSLIRPLNTVRKRLGEDGDYILQHDFDCRIVIDGEERVLTAPRGLITDLTSVPIPFRIFVGRVGPWLEAAILHDYLYVAWRFVEGRGVRPRDRLFADRVMLLAMEAAGVGFVRRHAIYLSLRLFGARGYATEDSPVFADLGDPALARPLVIPTELER